MPFAKPIELPRWADVGGGAGVVVPSSGSQDAGFSTNAIPLSTLFNWFQRRNFEWERYLDSRFAPPFKMEKMAPRADAQAWSGVAGDAASGTFVAVGKNGSNHFVTLPIQYGSDFNHAVVDVIASAALGTARIACDDAGLFVLGCNDSGNHARILTSVDGISWSSRLDDSSATFSGCSSLQLVNGLWIATFSIVADKDRIFTSTGGSTWTLRTNPTSIGSFVGSGFAGGLYVIIGNQNCTSPDGTTWTDRGIFMTGANGGTPGTFAGKVFAGKADGKIYSTSDAINWTQFLILEPTSNLTAFHLVTKRGLVGIGNHNAVDWGHGYLTSDGVTSRQGITNAGFAQGFPGYNGKQILEPLVSVNNTFFYADV